MNWYPNFTGMLSTMSRCADYFRFFKNGRHIKIAANIKVNKIVKNSTMKRFQWKWIFTGSRICCTIWRPSRFAMAAILNPKWPPKFAFQLDYDVANCYSNFTGMLSTMSRCADYFRNFQNGRCCHGIHKKHEQFKVLGIGWNFPEILSEMCTHKFEA